MLFLKPATSGQNPDNKSVDINSMEVTLEQALQKGIEAHKAGRLQEADRYYTAILKTNPKHPDANHNIGVLAVGVNKIQEALPFFKTAIAVNPSIAQYWLSYIEALIKLDQITDAKAVFRQAKLQGVKGERFDQLEEALSTLTEFVNEIVHSEKSSKNILDELRLDQSLKLAKRKHSTEVRVKLNGYLKIFSRGSPKISKLLMG